MFSRKAWMTKKIGKKRRRLRSKEADLGLEVEKPKQRCAHLGTQGEPWSKPVIDGGILLPSHRGSMAVRPVSSAHSHGLIQPHLRHRCPTCVSHLKVHMLGTDPIADSSEGVRQKILGFNAKAIDRCLP